MVEKAAPTPPNRRIDYVVKNGYGYSFKYENDPVEYTVSLDAHGNSDYHRILEWASEPGNTIKDADEPTIDLKAYAKQKRKELEEGGFDFNGLKIATDPDSQRKILGARVLAESNLDHKVQFNYTENEFVELDAPLIIALNTAVAMHIDRMFKAQSAVIKAIDESNIIDTDQVDNFFKTYGV